jgi:predicted cupin superfamily sugar epimerase
MNMIASRHALVDNVATMSSAVDDIVRRLGLAPHPEGGWFREVYRDSSVTTIHYLLPAGGLSPLHRLRSRAELWHFYGGAEVELHTIASANDDEGRQHQVARLAPSSPLAVVTPGTWQAARVVGEGPFAWCGCTVAPAFDFVDWEMPPRAELLRQLPGLQEQVMELTRP